MIKSEINNVGEKASKPTNRSAPSTNGSASHGRAATNPAELARTVKALVRQHGAEAVRDVVQVFAE